MVLEMERAFGNGILLLIRDMRTAMYDNDKIGGNIMGSKEEIECCTAITTHPFIQCIPCHNLDLP
jgi:hypothetical protein